MEGSITLQDEYTPNTSLLIYQQRPVRKYNSGGQGEDSFIVATTNISMKFLGIKLTKNVYCQNENDSTFPEFFFFFFQKIINRETYHILVGK